MDGSLVMQQSLGVVPVGVGAGKGTVRAKAADGVSAFFGSGVDRNEASLMRSHLDGSYTVEAALVMSLTLFFLAALLNGVFTVHSRVVADFVLQEALERCVFPLCEEDVLEETEKQMQAELKGFFGCGSIPLQIGEHGTKKKGTVGQPVFLELSVKEYEPEAVMRLWAVLHAGIQRRDSGGSLQERMEP